MRLFEPITILSMDLKNRIVMPPMGTLLANKDGSVSERLIEYYSRRAKGGAGLIVVEATGINSEGIGIFEELKICDDKFIRGLALLTSKVKSYGSKIGIQIYHPGRQGASTKITGVQPVAPSPIRYHPSADVPRELSVEEIGKLVEDFSEGARRAKEAGFDIVELHGAHGYLISEFLSPLSNRRTDGYGGGIKGRIKFATEIVRRTRQKVGSDIPIFFRISGDEYEEGGLKIDDTKLIAKMLVEAGVDVIDVSAGTRNTMLWTIQPMMFPRGCIVHLAGDVRKVVKVPVIAAGRINNPELAEAILSEGKADLIGIGRGLLSDPDFPRKAFEGKFDEIQKCIACNTCADREAEFMNTQCAINPETGNETTFKLSPALQRKKVMVVGGGPAGLNAARVLAGRGHEVVLYEKEPNLGGQLNLAGAPDDKEEFRNYVQYLKGQLIKLHVKVVLGAEVSPKTAKLEESDEVIVATGAYPTIPHVLGMESGHVVTAKAVLGGESDIGENIVIIGAGGTGCTTALYLAKMGKRVTLIEMLSKMGTDMGRLNRWATLYLLEENHVNIYMNTKLEEVIESGAIVSKDGEKRVLSADTIVLAMGVRSENSLFEYLRKKKVKVHAIGDCKKPRKVIDAVHEAFEVARQL